MLKLSQRGEQVRWRLAALGMCVILFEVFFQKVVSWGVYIALIVCAAGYFTGDMVTTKFGGGYFLTPEERASRRRLMSIPTLLVFYKGTRFSQGNAVYVLVLSIALFTVTLLVLVPEPRE